LYRLDAKLIIPCIDTFRVADGTTGGVSVAVPAAADGA
jgi:hypothetical protein